mmetsp:Transcript_22378/g.56769  ORF Transcript_22378/g.56769 Transcript_22378/m.56769 type:complete len:339 (-) Transcript_22378:1792-2808(-)
MLQRLRLGAPLRGGACGRLPTACGRGRRVGGGGGGGGGGGEQVVDHARQRLHQIGRRGVKLLRPSCCSRHACAAGRRSHDRGGLRAHRRTGGTQPTLLTLLCFCARGRQLVVIAEAEGDHAFALTHRRGQRRDPPRRARLRHAVRTAGGHARCTTSRNDARCVFFCVSLCVPFPRRDAWVRAAGAERLVVRQGEGAQARRGGVRRVAERGGGRLHRQVAQHARVGLYAVPLVVVICGEDQLKQLRRPERAHQLRRPAAHRRHLVTQREELRPVPRPATHRTVPGAPAQPEEAAGPPRHRTRPLLPAHGPYVPFERVGHLVQLGEECAGLAHVPEVLDV